MPSDSRNILSNVSSSSAEGLKHTFRRLGRLLVLGDFRLVVIRALQNSEQLIEGLEIAAFGSRIKRCLHAVIAGNEGGIHATHARHPFTDALRIARQAPVPIPQPVIDARGLRKQLAQRSLLASNLRRESKLAERQGEIRLSILHGCE